jgi:hypothetical protein
MLRTVYHLENIHWTDIDADLVAIANIMVNRDLRSMYAEFRGRTRLTPNLVTAMLTSDFQDLLKLGVYWHDT